MEDKMSGACPAELDFDVVVVGAGISGINAAYRIQQNVPKTTYTILEGRDILGGTWDLWRYPGIRSDSDVFTFSFAWNPWSRTSTLAMGDEIKNYMAESAEMAGIDEHIRYRHRAVSANWTREGRCWEITVQVHSNDQRQQAGAQQGHELKVLRSRFIFLGTGYYDYEQPLHAVIPGLHRFEGDLIRPQFWPQEYDYSNKEMVIIGSGAAAISILPAVAERVKHVTMVQRSPTWFFPVSRHGKIGSVIATVLPARISRQVNRYRWLIQGYILVGMCKYFPGLARLILGFLTARQLPSDVSWEKHFKPRYDPWEQRMCMTMDGDFFRSLRSGKASVVTDHIETVTGNSIKLVSGQEVPADVIVAATGIRLRFGGNIRFSVDGVSVDPTQKIAWKASMLQDLPNLVFSFGYENAAWTLGADCAAKVLIRLMRQLEKQGASTATPYLGAEDSEKMQRRPMFSLSSTYLEHMCEMFPQGGSGQWRRRSHYMADFWAAKWGDMKTGLVIE